MNAQEKMQLQETLDDFAYQLAELGRKIHLASGIPGAVVSYQPAPAHTAVVDIGYETQPLPVGDDEGDISPLRVGQLVHVFAPSGDLSNAFVKAAGYSGSVAPQAGAGGKAMSLPGGGVFRSMSGSVAQLEAGSIASLRLVLGGTTYTIKPDALQSS